METLLLKNSGNIIFSKERDDFDIEKKRWYISMW